jgi:hypothetical protein
LYAIRVPPSYIFIFVSLAGGAAPRGDTDTIIAAAAEKRKGRYWRNLQYFAILI